MELANEFFEKAVDRMNRGKCEQVPVSNADLCKEARELFLRAYDLHPAGIGALRNLARVERSLGMYASAARHYRELARKAPLDPKPARQLWAQFARDELKEVEPLIAHLVLRVAPELEANVTVSLDGETLPKQAFGVRLDVDPAEHTIHAEAPEHYPFDLAVTVREGETRIVAVSLEPQTAPPRIAEQTPPQQTPAPAPTVPPSPEPRAHSRVAPLVVAGAGVVGVGAGLLLGWAAIEKRVQACGAEKYCDPEAFQSGMNLADASTVVTIVGAAAIVGGGAWFFLSAPKSSDQPRAARVTPIISPSFAGLGGSGTF